MKALYIFLFGAVVASLQSSCASKPLALAPVGPDAGSQPLRMAQGRLQVFSATEKSIPFGSDDPTFFNLHTGYEIYDADGKSVKFVMNHASDQDEWPDTVGLAPGNYRILAASTWRGQVSVPVLIEQGKTTVVHLDNNWFPAKNAGSNSLVYLPNGEAVGWSAAANP
jgi:hypothetical protein